MIFKVIRWVIFILLLVLLVVPTLYLYELVYQERSPLIEKEEKESLLLPPEENLLSPEEVLGSTPLKVEGGILFRYLGEAEKVYLGGDFNQWEASEYALDEVSEGVWEIVVPLEKGRYLYKFKVDGKWVLDPANPHSVQEGATQASLLEVK